LDKLNQLMHTEYMYDHLKLIYCTFSISQRVMLVIRTSN